ncbi:Signal recognition particle subunit SRP72 [Halotydeus destructor]|nr:Signal recognition particle subunit SRP72 [Halotydeus destructor]
MAVPNNLPQLFTELHRASSSGEYEKGLEIVDKILKEDGGNLKAIHCKIVCLMKNGTFAEALDLIERSDVTLQKELVFEIAYCKYRLNKVQEAYDMLKAIKDPDAHVKELAAQALYRLEQYEDCYASYLDLIKNSADEYELERDTNLAAVAASLSLSRKQPPDNVPELSDDMYELVYNKACMDVGQGNHEAALKKLTAAEDLCRRTLKEEDATDAEIDEELGIIRAQMAFVYQSMGKEDIALKMYNLVLRNKPSDVALVAVTSNNIVTINRDQNVFDSKKRIKSALNDAVETKLSSLQRKNIAVNNCLLMIHTSQLDGARKQVSELRSKFKDAIAEAALLDAAILVKENKFNDAFAVLKKSQDNEDDLNSLELSLTWVGLLLQKGNVAEACNVLKQVRPELGSKLGVVSALVSLYLSQNDSNSVITVLENAINWHKKNNSKVLSSDLLTLYRETSRYLVQNKRAKDAVKMLEELKKANPSNPRVTAQLISAYSQISPQKAAEAMKDLPPIEDEIASVDIDALESSNWSFGAKYVKRLGKVDPSPMPGKEDEKAKKTRKRKKILPKNYDPTVDADPERWLPRWQRSAFKKKKKDKRANQIGKGTQGAVAGDPSETFSKPSPKAGSSAQPTSPVGPRQQRPAGKAKKKGKK